MRAIAFLLVLAVMFGVAHAAPPKCSASDDLPTLVFYVGQAFFNDAISDVALRDAIYQGLGEIKATARQKDNRALAELFAPAEYQWLQREADEANLEPWAFVGKLIDCANNLDIRKALYRDKGRAGLIAEYRAGRSTGSIGDAEMVCTDENCILVSVPQDWFERTLRCQLRIVKEARKQWTQ